MLRRSRAARKQDRLLSGLLDLSRQDGTESLHVEGWRRSVQPLWNEESARQSPEDVDPGSDRALGDHRVLHAKWNGGARSAHRRQDSPGTVDQVPIR